MEVILACDSQGGIGFAGCLPWSIDDELRIFKKKTRGHVVVVGRRTFETLPPLPGREVYCISSVTCGQRAKRVTCLEDAIIDAKTRFPEKIVFIAGGGVLYDKVFADYAHLIDKIHLSIVDGEFICDTWINGDIAERVTDLYFNEPVVEQHDGFTHCVYERRKK
jgi:dihydrofolate reductase